MALSPEDIEILIETIKSISSNEPNLKKADNEDKIALEYIFRSMGSGSSSYIHKQTVASNIWAINHPLNGKPEVVTYDSSGNRIYGSERYDSPNLFFVCFSQPIAGEAILIV